jgi:hypothetical protein
VQVRLSVPLSGMEGGGGWVGVGADHTDMCESGRRFRGVVANSIHTSSKGFARALLHSASCRQSHTAGGARECIETCHNSDGG